MSSLREQLKARSADLVRRETVTLPDCGLAVQVRGLMAGEVRRAGEAKRSADVQVALSAEDPATGAPIWNPNSLPDLDEIASLSTVDVATLLEASNRLSGMAKLGKLFSQQNGSSSSASPELLDAPSTS